MARGYSHRARTEEKKNIRKAFLLTILTVGLVAVILVFGIPLVVKYAGLITDIRKSSTPIEVDDTTPPPPPKIDPLPDFTNQTNIDINGSTEPGATVTISVNRNTTEILANKSGRFSSNVGLNDGDNTIFAYSKDAHGNESSKTENINIVFDNEPPDLSISSPENGSEFFGSRQRQMTISGSTEESSSVSINERFVVVAGDGSFNYTTTLSEGNNEFKIKAEDRAGNSTEQNLTVTFSE